jgi:hypothetical protein
MVTSQTSTFQYTLSTVVQALAYNNYFLANNQLRVVRVETDETTGLVTETLLTLDSDYSVSGALVEAGGTVTTIASGAHDLQIGDVIKISRNVPFTQETDYIANQNFSTSVVERDFDKLTMQVQQLAALVVGLQAQVSGFYEKEIDFCDGDPDDPDAETVTKVFLVRDPA